MHGNLHCNTQNHEIVMRNPWFCFAAYLSSKQTMSDPSDSTPSKWVSNAKFNAKGCQSKRSSHKEGRGPPKGYGGTQSLPSAPNQGLLAKKHGITKSSLQAWIGGHPSKFESAGQQQRICPDDEQLLVDYLQETACQSPPDTLKRATRCANETLCNLAILMLQLDSIGLISSWITTMMSFSATSPLHWLLYEGEHWTRV